MQCRLYLVIFLASRAAACHDAVQHAICHDVGHNILILTSKKQQNSTLNLFTRELAVVSYTVSLFRYNWLNVFGCT